MTVQEAIEILKDGVATLNLTELQPVYGLAIEALEKQIPKKPKESNNPIIIHGICPECNLKFTMLHRYCPKCGQKIDWSDWSEEE